MVPADCSTSSQWEAHWEATELPSRSAQEQQLLLGEPADTPRPSRTGPVPPVALRSTLSLGPDGPDQSTSEGRSLKVSSSGA